MDNELKAKMLQYLESIEQGVQQAGDFAKAEIPAVATEYVNWIATCNLVAGAFALIVALFCCFVTCLFIKMAIVENSKNKREGCDETGFYVFVSLVSSVAFLAFGGTSVSYMTQSYKAYVAPRVIILEKIQELTK